MTLFRAISGGLEWSEAAASITDVNFTFGVVWTIYIGFTLFGILNVLTGIFCDAAMQAASADRSNIIQSQLQERADLVQTVRQVFQESDADGSGRVTRDEFLNIMKNEELVAQLHALGVDIDEANGLLPWFEGYDRIAQPGTQRPAAPNRAASSALG